MFFFFFSSFFGELFQSRHLRTSRTCVTYMYFVFYKEKATEIKKKKTYHSNSSTIIRNSDFASVYRTTIQSITNVLNKNVCVCFLRKKKKHNFFVENFCEENLRIYVDICSACSGYIGASYTPLET